MAKAIFENEKSLENAKQKMQRIVDFRKTKYGVIAAKTKWPKKKKSKRI